MGVCSFYRVPFQHLLELFCSLNLSCVGVNYIIKLSAVNFLHPCGVIIFFRLRASAVVQGFVSYFVLPWARVSFLGVKAILASSCASANL